MDSDNEYEGMTKNEIECLMTSTYSNTEDYNILDISCYGKVVRVYDGDTIHVAIIINNMKKRIRCRLANIDTAEIRSKNQKEKDYALKTKNRIIELIGDNLVWLEIIKVDKYGRYLINLYKSKNVDVSINEILLNENMAYVYRGGKRRDFNDWYNNK